MIFTMKSSLYPIFLFLSKKKPITNTMLVIGLKRFWETVRIKFCILLSELVYTAKTN